MYQPYPSRGGPAAQPARPGPPRSVRTAVILMYAGAAVDLLSLIASLATTGALRNALRQAHHGLTPAQIHSEMTLVIVADVIVALISIGLWVGVARASMAGRGWARILGSVLFGIDTVLEVRGLLQASLTVSSLAALLIWVIGLGAVVMLWRRDSSGFFSPVTAARTR